MSEIEVVEEFYRMVDTVYIAEITGSSGRGLHIIPPVELP